MTDGNEASPEPQYSELERTLKAPRSAALAGIAFALLYGAALVLLTLSIPPYSPGGTVDTRWLSTHERYLKLALFMIPYAGIAFLWFIGVLRDQLGRAEDRFLASIFLGSGILFLAMTFLAAALMGGLLIAFDSLPPALLVEGGIFLYGRSVIYEVFQLYSIRMAALFMSSLGTIWYRTRVMSRAWAIITYALSIVLLIAFGYSLWILLIFPAWVLAVSLGIFVRNLRPRHGPASGTRA